ncbi:uncharacterized protein [Atheta coriaria]|uniref:uncharacterized protein n=1 Tax=Dalotia coriaria TaxID=877792 RepID=UPI0031F3FF02
MSAIIRLVGPGRRAINNLLATQTQSSLVRAIQIKALPRNDTPTALHEHDTSNMQLGRPMSPHLTVYQPQLTSFLSITHRITGMGMTAYIYMLAAGPLFWKDYNSFITAFAGLGPAAHVTAKFLIAFPLAYHVVNGLRHLAWDSGKFLTIKEVYSTGYAMVGMSLVLTAFFMSL